MANTKLRNIQFYRNGEALTVTGSTVVDLKSAYKQAEQDFIGTGRYNDMLDGEILLYRFSYDSKVHTLVGVVHAPETGTKTLEVLANYDMLGAEISNEIKAAIEALDATVRGTSDGVMNENSFDVTSATGAYVAVEVVETDGKLTAVNVKENIDETIQAKINALDTPTEGVSSAETNNVKVTVKQVDGIVNSVEVVDNSVNANDVATAITTAIEDLDSEVENATGDIKVKVTQVNGELTAVAVTDTLATVAHSGKAADVAIVDEGNLYTAGNVEAALAEVMTKANALNAAQLSAGNGISITDKKINSDFTVTIENLPESEGVTAGTYIVIKGNGGNGQEITKVNANAFVKDGFLQKVEKDAVNNTLKFTWNTDAGIEETTISISDLCDVYTADETYLHLDGYKFEHKTSGVTTGQYGADAAATLETTGESITFNVPSITVDAAGHITVAEDKAIKVALPASIDTAIQGGVGVDTTYIQTTVNRNATETNQLDVTATAIIGNYADVNQTDGLATTTATKTYVDSKINALDESTTILAEEGIGIRVADSAEEGSNDHKYTVNLAELARVDNPTAEGTAGLPSASSFADDTTTFTYVKAVNTDAYGRVTGILTETVKEDFDAGTY